MTDHAKTTSPNYLRWASLFLIAWSIALVVSGIVYTVRGADISTSRYAIALAIGVAGYAMFSIAKK
jgi:spore maturation protein SpmA